MNMTLPSCWPAACLCCAACSITKTAQYPRMLLQLLQAGFSVGHVSDLNYLTRPVSPVCATSAVEAVTLRLAVTVISCAALWPHSVLMWVHHLCWRQAAHRHTLLPTAPSLHIHCTLTAPSRLHCHPPQLSSYSEPLHQLQAVTEANLKYDLFDSMQMT